MKVIQVGGLAGPGAIAGGVWAVAETQTTLLQQKGLQVSLLGGWLGQPRADTDTRKYLRLFRPFPGAGLRGLWTLSLPGFLSKMASDAEIAHIHLSRDFLTTFSMLWFKFRGVPIVVQTHGMVTPGGGVTVRIFDLLFKHYFLNAPARWLALTTDEVKNLLEFGVEGSKITKISNTVCTDTFSWLPPSVPEFAFVSRLHARKQPDIFVLAAIKYLNSGRHAVFTVAGPDQGQLANVQRLIKESGHEAKITVRGALSPKDTYALLSSATALVLPSRGEIAPMIVLEAASIGTPIILTKDCGLSPDFAAKEAAIVVEPEIDSVADAMCRLSDDVGLAEHLSQRARGLFHEVWSEDAVMSVLLREYNSVTATAHFDDAI